MESEDFGIVGSGDLVHIVDVVLDFTSKGVVEHLVLHPLFVPTLVLNSDFHVGVFISEDAFPDVVVPITVEQVPI